MMNNLKKVLALVLVFAMSLSVVAFAGATYPDVADDATYAEAVTVLKSLGIMQGDEQGNFNPDKTVTRGEMATILCNLAGVGEQAPTDTGFADTTAAHWASGYVAYAKNAGWINGYDANTFGPDDTVKWEQAIKLVMAVANWGIYADENGGYPTGWVMAAAEEEVTGAGAAGSIGEDCSRAKIAMILYYALDANIVKQTSFGEKKWEVIEGETILSKNLNTYKVEGYVDGSYKVDTDLEEGEVDYYITKTNDIDVENKLGATVDKKDDEIVGYRLNKIDASATNAADLLKYSTVAYINVNDDDEASIVAIVSKGTRNKTIEITDMDLVWNSEDDLDARETRNTNLVDSSKYRFCYWLDRDEDNYVSSVKVDANAIVIYNKEKLGTLADIGTVKYTDEEGKVQTKTLTTDEILDIIVPVSGKITMVDTDNDGDIDLYEATAYGVAVVSGVNVAKQKILFKDRVSAIVKSGSINLDKEENELLLDVSITLNGEEIGIEDLAENDVLTISADDFSEPKYLDIIVSRNTIEGKVTGQSSDKKYWYIGRDKYEVIPGLAVADEIEVKTEGTFYLTADGKIALLDDTTVASTNYAIVDRFVKDTMDTVSMRIFTLEGTKLTANVADKVELNGTKVTLKDKVAGGTVATMFEGLIADEDDETAEAFEVTTTLVDEETDKNIVVDLTTWTWYELIAGIVDGTIDLFKGEDEIVNKLITYDVSGDEIDEITFAIDSTATNKFGYIGSVAADAKVEWVADSMRFKGSKTLSDKTVIFNIPVNAETGVVSAMEDWKVATAANLIDEDEYAPYYFALQKDGTVGAVILTATDSNINEDGSLAFFVESRTGVYEVNGDEENVTFVTYYMDGALVEEALPVDSAVFNKADLKTGDAFLFAKDDKGIVAEDSDLVELFDVATKKITLGSLEDYMTYDDTKKLDNEVYVGVLLNAANGKLTVADIPAEGATEIAFDNFINITVADTAKVLQYKAYASTDAKKIEACDTIVDLEVSETLKKSGTQDIDLTESELNYVFFRMYNGSVVEVVGLDYIR